MLLEEIVSTSRQVAATRSRRRKVELLAARLRSMGPEEVAVGVAYLSGNPRQSRLEVGLATLHQVTPPPASAPTLTLLEVDRAFDELAAFRGPGSRASRLNALQRLLTAATHEEQRFLRALMLGEPRQGALEGVVTQALGEAFAVAEADVRRAVMLCGELGRVAEAARGGGAEAVRAFRLRLFQPLQPMLAQSASDLSAALEGLDRTVVEHKLDGARIQVHRSGDEVRIYTRSLREVTDRLVDVVAAARSLRGEQMVLDGEVLALKTDGLPQSFQDTMRRFGSEQQVDGLRGGLPLTAFFFDCLHLDGEDLLDRPLAERLAALEQAVPQPLRVPSRLVEDTGAAAPVLAEALRRGHEGVMVKALDAPYEAGRRGAAWRKVKHTHTLDLVVLAAEWGHGRRRGWLSNLHLGARDPENGGFVMLGKTFKGLTDDMLAWQTHRLLELQRGQEGHIVHVRPELVVEVAFDGVQSSHRYPAGLALRFARVRRYRPDKHAAQADTVATVRSIHLGRPGEVFG